MAKKLPSKKLRIQVNKVNAKSFNFDVNDFVIRIKKAASPMMVLKEFSFQHQLAYLIQLRMESLEGMRYLLLLQHT